MYHHGKLQSGSLKTILMNTTLGSSQTTLEFDKVSTTTFHELGMLLTAYPQSL
jgi:hypothetical protein